MNVQESIRRILREEGFIPIPIKRRVSPEDIEEAFDFALEDNAASMEIPNSVIYKKKGVTLWVFAKFVIDDMVTLIEQQYFNDDNRIYFSDDEEDDQSYHKKIRQPLLRYYGRRIKEKYDEIMSSNDGEMIQESIRRILREERSLKTIVRDLVKNKGFLKASNVIGSLEKVHEILDLKGTQEDMMFIVKTILKHDLNEPMCSFVVSKWFDTIRILVNIPLRDPDNLDAWINTRIEIELEEKIYDIIYELGKGLVRGNNIKVSAVWC